MAVSRSRRPSVKRHGRVRVGISGWAYSHWKPHFYPKEVKDAGRLAHYAGHFDTVELNSTFYRPAAGSLLARWRNNVPDDFLFSVKAWRRFTHFQHLKVDPVELASFLRSLSPLAEKKGPALFQLPATCSINVKYLGAFLQLLPPDCRAAFEFRHSSWWTQEIFDLLCEHGAGFCIFDLKQVLSPMPVTADFVYVRLHGPKRPYFDHYARATLGAWARRVSTWSEAGLDVFFYFNNTDEAAAAGDATILKKLLAKSKPVRRPSHAKRS